MGQERTTMAPEKKAGGPLRRMILLLAVAAVIAATMAVSAGPASAAAKHNNNNNHHNNGHHNKGFKFDRNNDVDFVVRGANFDDQELESGDIETETDISVEGNNNNQCVGALQFGQTGNFANQQGTSEFGDFGDFDGTDFFFGNGNDNEFVGPETTFSPENETDCGDQAVQQASTASSWGSWW